MAWTVEHRKEYAKAYRYFYYRGNKEKVISYSSQYQKKYPEKAKLYMERYKAKNKEKFLSIMRKHSSEYYKKHREVCLMYFQLRDLMKRDGCW